MRKILSKKEQKSKERFNQILIGMILTFILVASILGYGLLGKEDSGEGEKIIFNDLEFVKINKFWTLEQGDLQFIFQYNPKEIEGIDSQVNSIDSYYNKPLYVDSKNIEARNEVYRNMYNLVLRMQNACFDEEDCEGDLPVKECDSNFIVIKEENITKITQNQSCVFIEGPKENLTMITDEFLFKTLGIRE